ncbi:uncharacterized protein JN550_006920 [Neoarthrinium moseri]|uniref:uncharacterized protein n=1 Tax=Neoarthrinium moseri TaxID=1658444 RepID=UPI001FDB5CCA|nr:uncharacterized protein JN550_006920 [Neoarthrinium moseri]KAI1867779.1 hypothetical protein JN550_006920 [Neoarthrinium moseri]
MRSTNFAISLAFASSRIAEANLSTGSSEAVLAALDFERSNWAGTSVRLDPFYTDLPANWTDAPAGSAIKIEQRTNTSLYTIAPTLAISRLVYTTKNLNGTTIPASAYVLWPWAPRRFDLAHNSGAGGLPVIAWAHGTSGWSGECGPSHVRSLWYQFMIFTAATQGYVVVAPDFAGLGLDHNSAGNLIPHQYLSSEAHGNDLLYAVQAAKQAWPALGSQYVVMGHSQGGGAAWGAARVLAGNGSDVDELRKGYLGSIAGSPWTSFGTSLKFQQSVSGLNSIVARIATGVASIFPSFSYSDWLTEKGVRAVELMQDLQGCQSVALELLSTSDLVREGWNQTWYVDAFDNLTTNIGKPVAGPLLVLQGNADSSVNATGTSAAVNTTCDVVPDAQIEYVEFEGVSHTPVMFAGQQVWLNWIADRFEGKEAPKGCQRRSYQPLLNIPSYQKDRNWFLEWNQYPYGVA